MVGRPEAAAVAAKESPKAGERSEPAYFREPDPLTALIGRETELRTLRSLIDSRAERLVTLIGPIGVGKSVLAATVASHLRHTRWRHAYLDVSTFDDISALVDATTAALDRSGHSTDRQPAEPVLVLLDNCNRLAVDVANLVASWLSTRPEIYVLATGRQPVGLRAERLFAVRPLAVPGPLPTDSLDDVAAFASVALFLERIRATRPEFRLTATNQQAIVELCNALDGLPLAIELAAARLKALQPSTLLAQLGRGLRALDPEPSNTHGHLTSLHEALAECQETLPVRAQKLLAWLGVFSETFDFTAVEAVTGLPSDSLQQMLEMLIDRSLISVDEGVESDLRFVLPGTTRLFALERLTADGERAEAARCRLFAAERGNLDAALQWLLQTRRATEALRLATDLASYGVSRGELAHGLTRLDTALAAGGRDHATIAAGLQAAGRLATRLGRHMTAADRHRRALVTYRGLGDTVGVARALRHLAVVAYHTDDLGRARSLLERSEKASQQAGDCVGCASTMVRMAVVRLAEGDVGTARAQATLALRHFERSADAAGIAQAHAALAKITAAEGGADVEDRCLRAIEAAGDDDTSGVVPACLELLAELTVNGGPDQARRAVRMVAAAAYHRDRLGPPAPQADGDSARRTHEQAMAMLGQESFEQEWAEGRSLPAVMAARRSGHDGSGPDGQIQLTARQQEVAELVARGWTNREIARELGISEWTAVNHVRLLLRKLRFPSRVHVAKWVAQQGRA